MYWVHTLYPLNALPSVRQVKLCILFKTVIHLLDSISNIYE